MSEEKKEEITCTIPLTSGFTHILFNLASQGYSHVFARYCGSGDDGTVEELYLVKRGGVIETSGQELPILERDAVLADIEDELSKLLMEKIYDIINKEADWYNNEGGGGTLFISTDDGEYKGDHYINVTETIHNDVNGVFKD